MQPVDFDPHIKYFSNKYLVRFERHFFAILNQSQKKGFHVIRNLFTSEVEDALDAEGCGEIKCRYN